PPDHHHRGAHGLLRAKQLAHQPADQSHDCHRDQQDRADRPPSDVHGRRRHLVGHLLRHLRILGQRGRHAATNVALDQRRHRGEREIADHANRDRHEQQRRPGTLVLAAPEHLDRRDEDVDEVFPERRLLRGRTAHRGTGVSHGGMGKRGDRSAGGAPKPPDPLGSGRERRALGDDTACLRLPKGRKHDRGPERWPPIVGFTASISGRRSLEEAYFITRSWSACRTFGSSDRDSWEIARRRTELFSSPLRMVSSLSIAADSPFRTYRSISAPFMFGSVVVSYSLISSPIGAPDRLAASSARRRVWIGSSPFEASAISHRVFSAPPMSASAENTASRERSVFSVGYTSRNSAAS